ncbi:MAG: indole-3-glycerol phosphate synthase TrpC [Dehalococcoidia bacterium]|jgi:indole-3-glycerol phosphate synthase|nr:indole-3-glycerol phosphate synthase TrpC [Dehalococcoidia bacterium]
MTRLGEIVDRTRASLQERKRRTPHAMLERMAQDCPAALDFAQALSGDGVALIAEVKRASPSRGLIRDGFDVVEQARTYAANGAAAISVLTEETFFRGSLADLAAIADGLGMGRPPLLRKDFIVDPYQVVESRAYGADSLLLIAAVLTLQMLRDLLELSHGMGMRCLVEVHDEAELDTALRSDALIIGVNNRDLRTFEVDLATFERLRPLIPAGRLVVAESGIRERSDVERLARCGVDAVLVGEALMRSPDAGAKVRELLCNA